jgi:type II secretory pathway component PulM
MPALPLGEAGPYVAAAYLVFLALILVYVGIMASKLVRIERQASELNELAARRDSRSLEGADERPLDARAAEPVERP